jgi:hypothetical protein
MTLKLAAAPRCSSGERCVAYPALGEPAKLSRGNPGPRCFACEERRVASELKVAPAREVETLDGRKANEQSRGRSKGLEEHVGREQAGAEQRAREVLERRRRSVLTCERGLRSALASGDERTVRRWSRSLRDAKARLAWAEADLQAAEAKGRADPTSMGAQDSVLPHVSVGTRAS